MLHPNKTINKRVQGRRSQVLCDLLVSAAGRSCASAGLVPWGGELCLPPSQLLQLNHCSEHSSPTEKGQL